MSQPTKLASTAENAKRVEIPYLNVTLMFLRHILTHHNEALSSELRALKCHNTDTFFKNPLTRSCISEGLSLKVLMNSHNNMSV